MLQARIGRLPLEARRVLRAASAFGQTFWSGGLAAVLDTTPEDGLLREALQFLIANELIERQAESAFPGQAQYGFRHILMREAAYALLAESDRVAVHRQAGRFLAVQAGVEPKMVAEHLVKGQEQRQAVPWFLQAARHAFDSNDLPAAMSYAEQAERSEAADEEPGAARALKREIAYWSGDYPLCRVLAEEELVYLRPGTARWYQAMTHALVARGRTFALHGFHELCTAMQNTPPSEEGEAVVEKIVGLCRVIHVLRLSGSPQRAESLCQTATELIKAHRVAAPRALAQYHEMRTLIGFESPLKCIEHCEKAIASYEQAGDVRNLLLLRAAVCTPQAWLGAGKDAEQRLRGNLSICQKMKLRSALGFTQLSLGIQLLHERRSLSEARQLLHQAGTWYREIGFQHYMKVLSLSLAELELVERNFNQALAFITESRSTAKTIEVEDFYVGISFALEARCLLLQGRAACALPVARRGYELRQAVRGISPADWEYLPGLVLAEVLLALGQKDEVKQLLCDLYDWVRGRVEMIPRPEWRSTFLRIADYALILELAAQLAGKVLPESSAPPTRSFTTPVPG